jgi:hypothetical protein
VSPASAVVIAWEELQRQATVALGARAAGVSVRAARVRNTTPVPETAAGGGSGDKGSGGGAGGTR